MPKIIGTCDGEAGCCPAVEYYQSRRVFFNQLQRGQFDPGQMSWAQPTEESRLLGSEAPGGDPAIANVHLHSIACVRELDGSIVGASIQPGADLATPGKQPPIGTASIPALVPNLPCDTITVGRGVGLPQYRVTFRDATGDSIQVFVDGSTVLSLAASHVDIDIITSPADFVLNPNANTPPATADGLYVDAECSASVSWGSRNAVATGPGGMSTFTQTQLVQSDNDPVGPTAATMLFERPPFARQVTIVPDTALVLAGDYAFTAEFVSGATKPLGKVPQGIVLTSHYSPERAVIPAAATHIRIVPQNLDAFVGTPISVVWLIGVR